MVIHLYQFGFIVFFLLIMCFIFFNFSNNLKRLQREAREEKLAKHRSYLESSYNHSYLSPLRPLSPLSPSPLASDLPPPLTPLPNFEDEEEPPSKKQKLFFDSPENDDDKENEHQGFDYRLDCSDLSVDMKDDSYTPSGLSNPMDDAQEILRDLYEVCTPEAIPPRPLTPSSQRCSDSSSSTTYSLSMSASCSMSNNNNNSNNNNSYSSDVDWSRQSSQYPCGHSSLLGNDLQSVVFHSLIASLES